MYKQDHLYHIYNQGINRQKIFHKREDYIIFHNLYSSLFQPISSTIAWCLMPTHFHFLINADHRSVIKIKQGGLTLDALSNSIRILLSSYARLFNNRYQRSGSLFRQKTRSNCLTDTSVAFPKFETIDEGCLNCFHYIHTNPVISGLVKEPEEWEFSSYLDYNGIRQGGICEKTLAARYCGYDPVSFAARTKQWIGKII